MSGDLTLEDICIHEGLDYKTSSGSSGEQLNLRECPNCGDDNWKVYANAESSLGNCFKCESFNLWRFVGWLLRAKGGTGDNPSIGRYLKETRKAMGYRPKSAPRIVTVAVDEETDVILPFCCPLPYTDGKNHPYLEERGISGDLAARFNLSFSSFGFHDYVDTNGEKKRQSFGNRIIIPVYDLTGRLVTFQGRDTTGVSDVRYKFAGGLPGTGRYLYNGHTARALGAKHVVMGEGSMDVMGIQKALDHFPDLTKIIPIGSFGMHLSNLKEGDSQVTAFQRLRKAGLETVTIMWDPEPKAFEEAIKAGLMLIAIGLKVRIAMLPAGQDPGEADATVIADAIRNAVDLTRLSAMRLRMNNPYK